MDILESTWLINKDSQTCPSFHGCYSVFVVHLLYYVIWWSKHIQHKKTVEKVDNSIWSDVFAGSSCHKFPGFLKHPEKLIKISFWYSLWLGERETNLHGRCTEVPELSVFYINWSIWVCLAPPHGVFPGLFGQCISVTHNSLGPRGLERMGRAE